MRAGIVACFLTLFVYFQSFGSYLIDEEDTLKQKLTLSAEVNSFLEWNKVVNRNVFVGGEINLLANDKFFLGVHGEYFIGNLIKRVVFPNLYSLDKHMYGFIAGYNFSLNKRLMVSPQFKYSFSYMRWTEREQERYYLDDHYVEFRPEIIIKYKILDFIHLRAGAGYTLVNDLQLSGIDDNEINGLTLSAGFGIRFKTR